MNPANQEKAMKMHVRLVIVGLLLGALTATLVLAEETAKPAAIQTPPSSPRPPKHLVQNPDGHWTAWNPPESPEGATLHKVVPGDTLWGLSSHYLNNPYLWPQIWDKNRWIEDTHWIYPGDPILLPTPEVVPEENPSVAQAGNVPAEEEGEAEKPAPATPAAPPPPPEYPIGDKTDYHCASHVTKDEAEPNPRIMAAEEPALIGMSPINVVYVNIGSADGYKPGDRLSIVRDSGPVAHPVTHKNLGYRTDGMGWVELIAVEDKVSTAVITFACEEVRRGDRLAPYKEYRIPTTSEPIGGSKINRYRGKSSQKASGYIVIAKDPTIAMGQGNVANVDLGEAEGVKPGDLLTIFRPNPSGVDLPRINLGEAVVLMADGDTSVVRITASVKDIYLGDRVEIQ